MKINRINSKNYESFIIDFLDGNISKDLADELLKFINDNPEINENYSGILNYNAIANKNTKFNFKLALKQNDNNELIDVNEDNYHEYIIAYYENDLNDAQKQSLFYFLVNNPKFENDFIIFKHTKTQADKNILFSEKSKLKKFNLRFDINSKSNFYKSIGIAASFLIIFSLFLNYLAPINNKELIQTSTINLNNKVKNKSIEANKLASNIKNTDINAFNSIKTEAMPNRSIISVSSKNTSIIRLKSINYNNSLNNSNYMAIDETLRNYYTSLNELMIFIGDSPSSINIAQQGTSENRLNLFNSSTSMFDEQPILAAGNYLVNLAIVGISKLEEISNNLKESYNTIEKRIENK